MTSPAPASTSNAVPEPHSGASPGVIESRNPATGALLGTVPVAGPDDVRRTLAAARRAQEAWALWRATPALERIQPLFRLKVLLEENILDLARTITLECGKTLAEAEAEMRRGVENVEVACGIPMLMQGYNNEDIARGILYLASNDSSFMTGSELVIDGGWTAR